MAIKNTKCSKYNKNNKKYINISWNSLDYIKNDIYKKLNTTLNNLKTIQTHIYWLKYILHLTKEHAEQKIIYIFIKLIVENK